MAEKCKKAKNSCHSDFEKNRKRRMIRHLKSNPNDLTGIAILRKFYGEGTKMPEPNHKGRRVIKFRHRWIQEEFDHKEAYWARREAERQREMEARANTPTIAQLIIAEGLAEA